MCVYPAVNSNLFKEVSTPYYEEGSSPSVVALPLTSSSSSSSLLVATNSDTPHWLFACTLSSSAMANCSDLSPLAKILPPRYC